MANSEQQLGQTELHQKTGALLRDLRERGVSYVIADRWGRPFAELKPYEEPHGPLPGEEVVASV